jgi:hypothetical protein
LPFWEKLEATKMAWNDPTSLLARAPCTLFSQAVANFQRGLEQDEFHDSTQIVENTLPWFSNIVCQLTKCTPLPDCLSSNAICEN